MPCLHCGEVEHFRGIILFSEFLEEDFDTSYLEVQGAVRARPRGRGAGRFCRSSVTGWKERDILVRDQLPVTGQVINFEGVDWHDEKGVRDVAVCSQKP